MAVQRLRGRDRAILKPESIGRIAGYGPTAWTAKHPRIVQGKHGFSNVTALIVSDLLGATRDYSDMGDVLSHLAPPDLVLFNRPSEVL